MQPATEMEQAAWGRCERAADRSPAEVEEIVTFVRLELYNRGLPCGSAALRRRLIEHYEFTGAPSKRTIARILARNGLTHGHTGWYDNEGPRRFAARAAGEIGGS